MKRKRLEVPALFRSGNLMITKDGRGQAFYRVPQVNYEFLSSAEKRGLRDHLANFLNEFPHTLTWWQVPVPHSPQDVLDQGRSQVPADRLKAWEENIRSTAEAIREMVPYRHPLYLAVDLEPATGNLGEEIARNFYEIIRDPMALIDDIMGGEPYRLPWSEWKRFEQAEEEIFQRIRQEFHSGIERCSESEVLWLIERCGCRGISPPYQEEPMELVVQDGHIYTSRADLERGLHDVVLDFGKQLGMVKWTKEFPDGQKSGWFSHLTLSWLPWGLRFPGGAEIFQHVRELDFPVELMVRTVPIPHEQALSQLQNVFQYITGQIQHVKESAREGDSDSDDLTDFEHDLERKDTNQELRQKVKEEQIPLFRAQMIFTVWGDSPKMVRERRRKLIQAMKEIDLRLEVPIVKQKTLYCQTLPGSSEIDSFYFVRPTAEFIASFMPIGCSEVGDPSGTFVGITVPSGSRHGERAVGCSPAYLDESRARNQLSLTSSMLIMGTLGRGKSMLANWLIYNRLMRGVRQFVFEPKDEKWAWAFELPELRPLMNLVSLSTSVRDKGKLDPLLALGKDPRMREDANERQYVTDFALTLLLYLAGEPDTSLAGQAIGYAVDETLKNDDHPTMMRVIHYLEAFLRGEVRFPINREAARSEVDRVASFLKRQATRTKAQLLFGSGEEDPVDLSSPLTIVQMQDLQFPDPSRPDYRQNMAVFTCIADLGRRFVNRPGSAKSVTFEEGHKLRDEKVGQMTYRELIRTCRSKDADVVMIVHNARDLRIDPSAKYREGEDGGEEIRSNMGNRCIFRVSDESEAASACEILGIEPTERNLSEIMNLDAGEWIMRDVEQRVAKVKFDLRRVNPRLFRAFDTRPEAMAERERKYGHLRNLPLEEAYQLLDEETKGAAG